MKKYLSYGGGVNSTALLILLTEQGEEFEAVFADHGGDYPETYEYVSMLQEHYPITIIKSEKTLYDYAMDYAILPDRRFRWCTSDFKVKPINKYFEKPCLVYIGFDAGEAHRSLNRYYIDGIEHEYPLIDMGIDRRGCKEVIKKAGLPLPRTPGCFFCPFQKKSEFRTLRDKYPDLYCKTKTMEQTCNARRKKQGKSPVYLRDHPIDEVAQEGQDDLFGYRKPCQCGL